jgi:DNA replication initiation complex subunit (GINS family)
MKDALRQYQTLKAKLTAEREQIQNRLAAINAVLDSVGSSMGAAPVATSRRKGNSNAKPGPSGYTPRKGSLPAKILGALEKSGGAMKVKDLATAVRARAVLVSQACLNLLSKGRLKREERGQYSLA